MRERHGRQSNDNGSAAVGREQWPLTGWQRAGQSLRKWSRLESGCNPDRERQARAAHSDGVALLGGGRRKAPQGEEKESTCTAAHTPGKSACDVVV